jgi:hypothetical protein
MAVNWLYCRGGTAETFIMGRAGLLKAGWLNTFIYWRNLCKSLIGGNFVNLYWRKLVLSLLEEFDLILNCNNKLN